MTFRLVILGYLGDIFSQKQNHLHYAIERKALIEILSYPERALSSPSYGNDFFCRKTIDYLVCLFPARLYE